MEKKKVLIIDDEPDHIDTMKTILESGGYEVSVAYDGKAGYEKAKEERPDLIVLDVMMTDMTEGFHTSYILKRDLEIKKIPILMVSAIHQKSFFRFEPDEAFLPVDEFLEKPIEPRDFLKRVEGLIKRPSVF